MTYMHIYIYSYNLATHTYILATATCTYTYITYHHIHTSNKKIPTTHTLTPTGLLSVPPSLPLSSDKCLSDQGATTPWPSLGEETCTLGAITGCTSWDLWTTACCCETKVIEKTNQDETRQIKTRRDRMRQYRTTWLE